MMMNFPWTLTQTLDAICFDCDGTMSAIEGINELAKYSNTTEKVEALTNIAMSETGITPTIYSERLKLIYPTQDNLITLAETYFENIAPDIAQVIQTYQRLNKVVYIISAGMNPAIKMFGNKLGIPSENIYAVDLFFDENGKYEKYDHSSPLIHNDGKRFLVNQIKSKHPHILHIGDGLNDVATMDIVTRFVGYGGFFNRDHIAELCQFYIRTKSLSALLPLSLTEDEQEYLTDDEQGLYHKGLSAIKEGMVKV